ALQHQRDRLALEQLLDLLVTRIADTQDLVTLERAQLTDPLTALLLEERIVDPAAEHLHVDDRAFHSGRHLERRVLYVLRLLTEDRRQQLLFRRQLGLALRRDLAD